MRAGRLLLLLLLLLASTGVGWDDGAPCCMAGVGQAGTDTGLALHGRVVVHAPRCSVRGAEYSRVTVDVVVVEVRAAAFCRVLCVK